MEQAQSELEILSRRLRREHPSYDSVGGGFHFVAQPYLDNVVGSVRPALLMLMGAVGLVLLIACANVANLLLARITGREREIAIRVALGAGHGRILRQMLTECLLFSLLGGLGALVVARWAFRALALLHPDSLPRMGEVGLDTAVLAFNMGLVVFTTLAVGGIPAIRISRMTWPEKLKDGARQGGIAGRHRSRAALVVTEVAFATVLLVGAGFLIRSFQQLLAVDPGFRAEQILTTQVTLSAERYPDMSDRARFFRQLMDELAAEPGVISAGAVSVLPMSGNRMDWYLRAEGYQPA
ncbi:MAG: FtsX-like permease family protein, partial [bacterium]|nr:FtsX-like permease family protein [bacterium]